MDNFYTLNDDGSTASCDAKEWERIILSDKKVISLAIGKEHVISTVFIGIDHNFSGVGRPILFESMVFGRQEWSHAEDGITALDQERYATLDEAKAGHKRLVAEWIKDGEIAND